MNLVNQPGVEGTRSRVHLATLNKGGDVPSMEVPVEVSGASGRRKILLPKAYALEAFPVLTDSIAISNDVSKWEHLRGISVPRAGKLQVDLLIGQDVPQAVVPVEMRCGQDGEPFAVRTSLGWTINGPLSSGGSDDNAVSNLIHAVPGSGTSLETQVDQFWRLDTGQLDAGQAHLSVEDK